jgi:arylsulfatase A-like enzyme
MKKHIANKSSVLIVFISILLLSFSYLPKKDKKITEKKQPNILFLFADDQRAGTIRTLGNQEIITPNIDNLANSGVSFDNAYIMGSFSSAVCSPSRAMLMTGRNLYGIDKQGGNALILAANETLPETLRKSGYQTFGTGKQHNGKDVFARGFSDGAEIFFGGMTDQWNVPVYHFDTTGKYNKKMPVIKNPEANNQIEYKEGCDHIMAGKHSSELFSDAAIEFLKRRDTKKPFFAYVSFTAPHDPRSMPIEYEKMYDTTKIAVPPNFLPNHPWDFGEYKIRDEVLAQFPRTIPEVKTNLRDYYASITHLDAQIGRIIEALKQSGEYENTIIIYAADNGIAIGQHGLFGKQNLYEHSINVPFIISGPNIPKNQRSGAFCYLFDLFPTICELLNIEIPKTVQGKSFIASVKEKNKPHRESMIYGYKEFMRGYRKGDYKLIEYFVNGERHSQFFNVAQDKFETKNLLDAKKSATKYAGMKQEMIQEMKKVNDTNQFYKELAIN